MDRVLIERAIESAKARVYKISVDEKRNPSSGHLRKIERQKEVAEVTVMALERMLPKKLLFNGNNWYKCPNCCEVHKKQFEKDWYCPKCGQCIDLGE